MLRAILATAVLATGAFLGTLPEAQAQGLVPCAREHGFCRVPYPTRVIYGVPGRSVEMFVRGGGVPCSNRVFGDPAPGIVKRCAFVARGGYDRGFDRGYGGYDDGYRRPPRAYGQDYGGYERDYRRDDRRYREDDDGYRRTYREFEVY